MKIEHMYPETKRTHYRTLVALAFGLAMIFALLSLGSQAARPAQASGTTFTVNSTSNADHGSCNSTECTLREAINAANRTSGADTIKFNIPSSDPHCDATTQVCNISLDSSGLPAITHPVTIDGYTQPGASPNTLTEPDKTNAVLKIELVGGGLFFATDSNFGEQASNSVIRGLAIGGCSTGCNGGITLWGGKGYKVEGNFIGTRADGTTMAANHTGVFLETSIINTSGSTIGGATPDTRNIISGNFEDGVSVPGGTGNTIEGNLIGTDKDGSPIPNDRSGVLIGNSGMTGNRILSNSIYANRGLGIDLSQSFTPDGVTPNDDKDPDTGPNNLQNYPVITSATNSFLGRGGTSISGTLNSTPSTKKKKKTFIIEFFSSPEADHPSGYGEGKTYLGQTQVTTDKEGNASFSFSTAQPLPADGNTVVTATATNKKTGDTSEFSQARAVTVQTPF